MVAGGVDIANTFLAACADGPIFGYHFSHDPVKMPGAFRPNRC
jgi:hypothetical protein